MYIDSIQLIEIKLTRLFFYLGLYLLPALIGLVLPQRWLLIVATTGLLPGLWRGLRRAYRRNRLDFAELILFALMTALVAVVVAGVSGILGWISIPCWTLVALEQAHRRERQSGLLLRKV